MRYKIFKKHPKGFAVKVRVLFFFWQYLREDDGDGEIAIFETEEEIEGWLKIYKEKAKAEPVKSGEI